jgi:acyl carrier protein
MTQLDQQKKQKFYDEVSKLLKTVVVDATLVSDLSMDSMSRSEIIFLIEDIFGVDCWGKRIQDYVTLEDLLIDAANP